MNFIISDNLIKKLKFWLNDSINNISQLYMVGGTVRDLIINREPKDIDFVCHNALNTAEIIAKKRKAALVPMDKKADEACYRVINRNDPVDYIDISEIKNNNIIDDLLRRDFTINAMALKINRDYSFKLIDNASGHNDILEKTIRNVTNESFKSDPLRILRAIRFSAQLDYKIEENTKKNISKHVLLLKNIAFERIVYELKIILENKSSSGFFKNMDQLGILDVIFPEITEMKSCSQNWYHDTDVWNHSLITMKFCEEIINNIKKYFNGVESEVHYYITQDDIIPMLKLGALFHDIGKPKAWKMNSDTGRITFHNHAKIGKIMIENLANRLRLSRNNNDFLSILVNEHLHVLELSQKKVRKSTIMKWIRNYKDNIIALIILGIADRKATRGPKASEEERNKFISWAIKIINDYFNEIREKINQKDLITGKDLIDMNLKPGPVFGLIINQIREARDNGVLNERDEALSFAGKLIEEFKK